MSDAPRPSRHRRRHKARATRFAIGTQEFVQTGLEAFDFHDPYYFALSLSWRDFALMFVAAELVINTVFGLFYWAVPGCVANARPGVFTDVFFFSVETLATVGYGVMAPATLYGHLVSAAETVTGLAFTAIMTGLLFVRFSKARARIIYAEHPVVTVYNGVPTLMLRIGNARANLLTNARATMHALMQEKSAEGHHQRTVLELRLVRPHLPIFAILWNLIHVMDETSPLYGADTTSIEGCDLRLFITVTARDQALGQEVSDVQTYAGEDIRFGMRYTDAIQRNADNSTTANYALISAIEPDA